MAADSSKPPSSSFEGDFAPGEVLIGRYRIVALVGEGGMGHVYLADDLVLGQPVAVKFLPERIAEREGGLERFRAEVRHAREVTHPNVARVHDIGEVDGRHFLTMEFVDGEDLSSLIRRIGRLPREKAAEIAQQICAGLTEAHQRGVLHRDLKPANVMLDGEGRVKLTDFGLAVAAEDADGALAGTPPYMAPEQLSGVPANEHSEIYSLGLLLYELYTGKRALRGRTLDELRREHEDGGPDPPSSRLNDIDPGVDAVLTRCLARDPKQRPASVPDVARALPGGDPLAAALASGQTPSPDMVAAARSHGALAPRAALALLLASAAFVVAVAVVQSSSFAGSDAYGKPPAVLRERALELALELTGVEEFPHEIHWYFQDPPTALAVKEWRRDELELIASRQALLRHARFGLEPFVSRGNSISSHDPPPAPGSAYVVLDAGGRLVTWRYDLPPEDRDRAQGDAVVSEETWRALLERADLDPDALREVEPSRLPPNFATERRAWELPKPGDTTVAALRIEAAALYGRPVHFELLHGEERLGATGAPGAVPGPFAYFLIVVTVLASLLAWRNVRRRRADVGGALVVGAYALVTHIVLVFGVAGPDDFLAFGSVFFRGLSYAAHTAAIVTVCYLAMEPFARRRWPRTLISWSRLLEGKARDPDVGREVLLGVFAGCAVTLLGKLGAAATGSLDATTPFMGIEGPLQASSHVFHFSGDAVMFSGLLVFLLVVLRSFFRVPWLTYALVLALLPTLIYFGPGQQDAAVIGPVVLMSTAFLVLLTRVGFLSVVVLLFVSGITSTTPLTLTPGDWYFGSSLMTLVVLALLGIGAYRVAVAGSSLFDSEASA